MKPENVFQFVREQHAAEFARRLAALDGICERAEAAAQAEQRRVLAAPKPSAQVIPRQAPIAHSETTFGGPAASGIKPQAPAAVWISAGGSVTLHPARR